MRISLSCIALAILTGTSPLLFLSAIPPFAALCLMWAGGVALLACRRRAVKALAVILLSAAWAGSNARGLLQMLEEVDGKTVRAEVRIAEVRFAAHADTQLVVSVENINGRRVFPPFYARLSPSSDMSAWCGGQRWSIAVRLRALHSRLNQGGFDSQRWGMAKRQPVSGNVAAAQPVDAACHWRQRLIFQAERQSSPYPWQSVLLALTFGEMKTVEPATKTVLQQTGTMHLMAISGLHIVLAALFGWGIARGIQFLLPAHLIGYRFPLLASIVVAWGYVWLAGGNPPAVRAALAFSVWAAIKWQGIACSAWQVWLWCVALILVCDPLTILSDSFWLSCLAVAALIFWFQWAPLPARCRQGVRWAALRWLHLQVGITLLLMPLQVGVFHGVSLTSLPANLWAVPLVSFITTPLVLLALPLLPFPSVNHGVWWLADRSLQWVFSPLTWMQHGWIALDGGYALLSIVGWLGVAIWRFSWWKEAPCSVLALAVFLMSQRVARSEPEWRVDMLDVGHGLAVVVERRGKAVIYDTGNRWDGGDMATREILPYLRWRGVKLEHLILSHSHLDHAGGMDTLLRAYPGLPVYSPLARNDHRPCVRGERWQWRGLTFTALWPPRRVERAENNDSCVLRIDDGKHRVLLTGDIEAKAELQLVVEQREALAAELLQIPHHGSKTSSSPPFLRAVNPRQAISSSSRYNAWRLPSAAVVRRYRQHGYPWSDTARSGQISARFFNDRWEIRRFREQISPRWYHQWFGVQRDSE